MKKYALEIIVFLAFTLGNDLIVVAVRTNVNEVNDLFDRNIENKEQLIRDVNDQREGAVRQIEAGNGLEHIEGINEAEGKARELESIREVDLESSGRQKRVSEEYRFYDENELEPDYSKPGNLAHKRDADEIIAQTGLALHKLGKDLQAKLSALGIDCHQVKGPVQKDLTYHIEISGEEHKNSEYEQIFCEEPRNRYNCHDSLTVRCNKRKIKWGTWQNRIIEFEGSDVFYNHRGWTKSAYYPRVHESSRGWISMTRIDFNFESSAVLISIGDEIARKLGVLREQITDVEVPVVYEPVFGINWQNPYHGAWFFIEGNTAVFKIIRLHYKFRTREEICEEWIDEWDEVCGLAS